MKTGHLRYGSMQFLHMMMESVLLAISRTSVHNLGIDKLLAQSPHEEENQGPKMLYDLVTHLVNESELLSAAFLL